MRFIPMMLTFGILLCVNAISAGLPKGYPVSERQKLNINQKWQFHLGDAEAKFYTNGFDDKQWKTVSVPHTLSLTSLGLDSCRDDKTQPTFQRNVGWYRKSINVTADVHKKVFLEFEGAHQITDLWVNGKHVGQHAIGGYTPFHFDISDHVVRGKANEVTLLVDNRVNESTPPDGGMFDYIKFSGLYRDVYLVETNPVHVTFNWEAMKAGVNITTPTVDPVNMNAIIDIKTVVRNENKTPKTTEVLTRIVDKAGVVVLKLNQKATIKAGEDFEFNQIGAIEDNLHLWSIETPYLYHVNTLVMVDGVTVDCVDNTLGIRKFELDYQRGFLLNNKPVKLIGVNRHQHYGYIGDALPNSLHYKDVLQLKQLGCNVIRTAHYPQDDALIEACDQLGVLIYEEAPTWIKIGTPAWFDNYEEALRRCIRNHRNHPSVVIWGAGINHRGYVPSAVLAAKQEDPTRFTASQSSRWTGWQTSGLTDLFANMMYGPGIWDRSEPLLAMEGRSGPEAVAEYMRDPLLLGLISWTAHAYYTFHNNDKPAEDKTRSGMMTVFRQPRKSFYWYPSEFLAEPVLNVVDQWTKDDAKKFTVYSNCDMVELLLNGKSIACGKPSADSAYIGLNHAPFEFKDLPYADGKLEVRGLKNGVATQSKTIFTPGKPVALSLRIDTLGRKFTADGSDILPAYVTAVDKNGTAINDPSIIVKLSVEGDASVIGDNARIYANPDKLRNGEAAFLVQAGYKAGKITLKASAKGLKTAMATTQTVAAETDMVVAGAYTIYDNEVLNVDLGAADQLVQFGWTPWNGVDNMSSNQHFDALGGFDATLKCGSDKGVIRWLGEMNVIGKYGFVYGEGVLGVDSTGLNLVLQGLKAGKYTMTTYHHAPSSNTDSMDPNREKLKSVSINKLPYANTLNITVADANGSAKMETKVTSGSKMQYEQPGMATFEFSADGVHEVVISIKDPNAAKGIWFNGFSLVQWK